MGKKSFNKRRGSAASSGGGTCGGDEVGEDAVFEPMEAQREAAPNSLLLAIDNDPISRMLKFLPAKALCHTGMVCKTLRRLAGIRLDRLIEEMDQNCNRQSVGEGGRTRLVRYQAAMEMAEKVRRVLEDHLSRGSVWDEDAFSIGLQGIRPRMEAKCRGCRSFPQGIDKEVFYGNGKDYEFFLCCFERGGSGPLFEGFVPMRGRVMRHTSDRLLYNFVSMGDLGPTPNWDEMRQFTSDPTADNFVAVGTSKLSIIAIAVRKSNCDALFLGADGDYSISSDTITDYGGWEEINVAVMEANASVLCDVHLDSRSFPKKNGYNPEAVASTEICIVSDSISTGDVTFQISLGHLPYTRESSRVLFR